MKTPNKKAQFILIMALSLIMLMVTAYTLFFTINRVQHSLQQAPTEPIITVISRDFERAALNGLRYASNYYYTNSNLTEARIAFSKYITQWAATVLQTYSDVGLELWVGLDEDVIIHDNYLGNVVIPKALTPQEAVKEDSWFKLYCYGRRGISVVALKLKCNVTKEGIIGYEDFYFKMLNATLIKVTKINDTAFSITVNVFAEEGKPVLDLDARNFNVTYMVNVTLENGGWELQWGQPSNPTIAIDYGNGTYKLIVVSDQPVYYFSNDKTFIILSVRDNLYVKCELCNTGSITYRFQSSLPQPQPNEIYYIEILANGTIIWNFQKIADGPPLPPIPVKHLWVNVSKGNDLNRTYNVTYQVERWEGNKPLNPFIETSRINSTCRLVFPLNFSDTTIRQKNVTIWWTFDADRPPQQQLIYFEPNPTAWHIIRNGVYEINLLANVNYSSPYLGHDNYTLIMRDLKYNNQVNYFIGISHTNWYSFAEEGGIKLGLPKYPKELPIGENLTYTGWKCYIGPIRAVMYRSSNNTYDVESISSENPVIHSDRICHEEILIIPYGVHYAQLKLYVKWINDCAMTLSDNVENGYVHIKGGPYYCLIGMLYGSPIDYSNDYEDGLNYYAFEAVGSNEPVQGDFPSSNDIFENHLSELFTDVKPGGFWEEKRSLSEIGRWFCLYRKDEALGDLCFGVVYDDKLKSASQYFPINRFKQWPFIGEGWRGIDESVAEALFYNKFIVRTSPTSESLSFFNDYAKRIIEIDAITDYLAPFESLDWDQWFSYYWYLKSVLGYLRYDVPKGLTLDYWVVLYVDYGDYKSIAAHAPMFYNPPCVIEMSTG